MTQPPLTSPTSSHSASSAKPAGETPTASNDAPKPGSETSTSAPGSELFGKQFNEKERKQLFLSLTIGIVLMELAVTVGAVVYSVVSADRLPSGMLRFNFPWLGYLVAVILAPVLVMLLLHLLSLGFSRTVDGDPNSSLPPGRASSFFALVRGAPTVVLFACFVLMGAAIYYLDGVMALLLKLGDAVDTIAVWLIGAFAAAWIVSYVARQILAYKARQMDAEYAFRREVLERTGLVLLDARHAPAIEPRLVQAALTASATLEPGAEDSGQRGTAGAASTGSEAAELILEAETVPEQPAPEQPADNVDPADEIVNEVVNENAAKTTAGDEKAGSNER